MLQFEQWMINFTSQGLVSITKLGNMKIKQSDVTSLVAALDPPPFATISLPLFTPPRIEMTIVVYKVLFDLEECSSLDLYAMNTTISSSLVESKSWERVLYKQNK